LSDRASSGRLLAAIGGRIVAKKRSQKIEVEVNVAALAAEVAELRKQVKDMAARLVWAEARINVIETPATSPNRPWYVRYLCG
jgi:hypothetical protein